MTLFAFTIVRTISHLFQTKSGTGHIFFVRFSDSSIMYLAVAPDEEANVNRQVSRLTHEEKMLLYHSRHTCMCMRVDYGCISLSLLRFPKLSMHI